jgi:hypothetical protein
LYEDNEGRIGYADALHRQNYLANNGYTEISANTAFGAGLKVLTRGADVRNDVFLNYGNNFGSQVSAIDLDSIEVFGYRGETINTVLHDATDAQSVANRFISLRSYPRALFDSITFPLTNSAIDDADRDALLGIFVGQPMRITDLPIQIAPTQQFEGYVEGWRWSTRFNELFLTINLSPIEFSQVAVQLPFAHLVKQLIHLCKILKVAQPVRYCQRIQTPTWILFGSQMMLETLQLLIQTAH